VEAELDALPGPGPDEGDGQAALEL
jgi:hypothetical protein